MNTLINKYIGFTLDLHFSYHSIMKKRSLTLIEVMVALGIASLLLAVLFPYLRDTIRLKKELELERAFIFSKAHVQERLATLFAASIPRAAFTTIKTEDHLFELRFAFDNGYDFEEAFRHQVMGHLYVEQKKLMLKIQGKKNEVRKEVLLENVREVDFKFAYPTPQGQIEEKPTCENKSLPLFFILAILFPDGREDSFYFRLQSSNRLEYP